MRKLRPLQFHETATNNRKEHVCYLKNFDALHGAHMTNMNEGRMRHTAAKYFRLGFSIGNWYVHTYLHAQPKDRIIFCLEQPTSNVLKPCSDCLWL